jgi:molybdate transport system regulatory protein
MPRTRVRRRVHLVPRMKIWLEIDGRHAFCFGLSEMLRAVDEAGSIKQAAGDLGKSYRHVWGCIKDAEKHLGRQLVETQVGGKDPHRSCLTAEARQLVAAFQAVRARLLHSLQAEFTRQASWPALQQGRSES